MSVEIAQLDVALLPREQRGEIVARALRESRSWLAVASRNTDPTPIVEFRAWAATVAEMAKQKGLAEEIQLDALEMVRRAERGIGLAVRNGQQAGDIAALGYKGVPKVASYQRVRRGQEETVHRRLPAGVDQTTSLLSPAEFFTGPQERVDIYRMTDGVSDAQFEAALAEARAEGSLSRANVVRKMPSKNPDEDTAEPKAAVVLTARQKIAMIRELAASGHSSRQIAPRVDWSEDYLRRRARENNIDIPADRVTRGSHHVDPERVVRETVHALEGLAQGLGLLSPEAYDDLDPALMTEWRASLNQSMRSVRNLVKELSKRV